MSLLDSCYDLQSSWTKTATPSEKLSKAVLKNVNGATIREHQLSDGTTLRNVVLLMKNGPNKSIKLASDKYGQEQFEQGTAIDPASIVLSEYENSDGDRIVNCTCEEL